MSIKTKHFHFSFPTLGSSWVWKFHGDLKAASGPPGVCLRGPIRKQQQRLLWNCLCTERLETLESVSAHDQHDQHFLKLWQHSTVKYYRMIFCNITETELKIILIILYLLSFLYLQKQRSAMLDPNRREGNGPETSRFPDSFPKS